MKRLLPAGLGASGIRTMWVLGALGALKAVALVVLAEAVTRGIVGLIEQTDAWRWSLVLGAAAALLRGGVVWATGVVAARAAIGTKERLRHDLAERAMAGGVGPVGSLVTLATRGLDDLDHYFSRVLPAVATTAAVPLLVGARILFADWVSALVIVVTIPLIPIFMALIGMQTADRVRDASAALARLSDHLVELARGLPVLVGLGRVDEQSAALDKISRDYRVRTMATLRTAFMSSLALELIATISVAVVAVFIGFRLVDGSLPLEIGLLVLILAPECYAPFREVGTAFHAASDGVAAVDRARAVIDQPVPRDPSSGRALSSSKGSTPIHIRGLTVSRAERGVIIDDLDLDMPQCGITALAGASGRGKSTVLAVLAGRLGTAEGVVVDGSVSGIDPLRVAWAPQHPVTVATSVAEELRIYGATDVPALLSRFDLADVGASDPTQLSPGELRRLAIARAVARVECGATLVLLDEPTAHLDAEHALVVMSEIQEMARVASVVVASHEADVLALADRVVWLGEPGFGRSAGAAATSLPSLLSAASLLEAPNAQSGEGSFPEFPTVAADLTRGDQTHRPVAQLIETRASEVRTLLRILAPTLPRLVLAVFLGTLAALFAVALTAVSGWLIVRASQQPAIM